jgi:Domain of unknown function (DUF4352)
MRWVVVNDNQFENATAQGQWCLMSLSYQNTGSVSGNFESSSYQNTGSVSGNFESSSQYVYDSNGKQYSADTNGTMAANSSGSQCVVYQQINPGVVGSCVVAFDVPKGVTPFRRCCTLRALAVVWKCFWLR